MRVRFLGHSCLQVEIDGVTLLFDPFIRPNPLAAGVDFAALKPDIILLTHGHGDHCADALDLQRQSDAHLVANFEIGNWHAARGVAEDRLLRLNLGGGLALPGHPGLRVDLVAAVHSSSMPDGSYGGQAGGFVVTGAEGCFYHSGDTALTLDMQLLGERHDLDWAALCLGDVLTMGIDDAIECAHMIGVERIVGLHYDTFPPIRIDHDDARRRFGAAGLTLHLPSPGADLEL